MLRSQLGLVQESMACGEPERWNVEIAARSEVREREVRGRLQHPTRLK
jgi:hypothetical protein